MSVDLRSNTMFARISLLLTDDSLIKLEHGRTQDRVRRYSYDRIESVVITRQVPWVRLIICLALLLVPGGLLLLVGETDATVWGVALLTLCALMSTWYLYCKKSTIRIVRVGQSHEISGIFRPGRLQRFRERLIAGITAVQSRAASTDSMTVFEQPSALMEPGPDAIPDQPATPIESIPDGAQA